MHGRIKVRTSEEEKARKEKERQEKLKVFKHVMYKIQSKRKESELDKELLELTGKVLSSNPDIYTLWNIRREVLNILRKTESEEELSQIYDAELQLTEYCLKINPKSYCSWHQRQWVLTTRIDPDWKKELVLCDLYLNYDERNFHTWDYRRFVVRQCKPPLEQEFKFTTEKLHDNFSNYSAWHYRSKMLVELYPDLKGGRPIEDDHHKHELKMVQSAAFTDPDDTSAWFYQKWLLDAVKTTKSLVVYTITPTKATFAFSKAVNKEFVTSRVKLFINNETVDGEWTAFTGNQYDVMWLLKHGAAIEDGLDVTVEFESESNGKDVITGVKHNEATYVGKNKISFQRIYADPVLDELKSQLDSCRQLLALEPDSKFTMLTTTVFLHCIDAKKYHREVIDNLQNLKTIDKLRAGYYADLITKWNIEEQLTADYKNCDLEMKVSFKEKLISLPHIQYYSYCEKVDLSNQELTSVVLPSLAVLQNCKVLNLKNNKLKTLKNFPELTLTELNIEGNDLEANEIEQFKNDKMYNIIY